MFHINLNFENLPKSNKGTKMLKIKDKVTKLAATTCMFHDTI